MFMLFISTIKKNVSCAIHLHKWCAPSHPYTISSISKNDIKKGKSITSGMNIQFNFLIEMSVFFFVHMKINFILIPHNNVFNTCKWHTFNKCKSCSNLLKFK